MWPEALERVKTKEKRRLPPLLNADKYTQIVTRFSPNPDCVLHLGSARAIILCYEYAKIYNGRFLLRFEDTDPQLKRCAPIFYDLIRGDLVWLGCNPDEEYIQSDRVNIYYKYAEKLLSKGHAYVCTCEREKLRERILASLSCGCRNLSPDEHIQRWKDMLDGNFKAGEAVVRLKTDLNHPNPAVRDWPALRIVNSDKFPHPRVGSTYHVWPLYNFACGIDDHLMGVTHIIRGKEHLTNMVRQKFMYRYLGWSYPEAIHYGRLKIEKASLSKSRIVQSVRDGLFTGWDDPRLATFAALRRRGITAEAIRRLIIDVGPKPSDVVLSWENLYAHNRKILDPKTNRYFFVQNPIQLKVQGIPKTFLVKLRLHPQHLERGFREFKLEPHDSDNSVALWISLDDAKTFKAGLMVRLMELFNFEITQVETRRIKADFISEAYSDAKQKEAPLIHWVKDNADIPCKVVMPDSSIAEGVAEDSCGELKVGEIIQFERFGFARIDKLGETLIAYYAHR
jgi:glutamyl-tRNA synthetase